MTVWQTEAFADGGEPGTAPRAAGHGKLPPEEDVGVPIEADHARTELVHRKAEQWANELIDLGNRNTLLRFTNTRSSSLNLTECDPAARKELFAGNKTALQRLFPDQDEHRDACTRARKLHRTIRGISEEQGLDVGKLACGLVKVPPPRIGSGALKQGLRAPLLLRPVVVHAKTASQSDFTLQAGDDTELNRVLLYALVQEYGIEVDIDALAGHVNGSLTELVDVDEQIDQAYQALSDVVARHGVAVELERTIALGLFKYEKLPMVNDLRAATELLAEHPLIAAMAGCQPSADELPDATADRPQAIGTIDPADEYLVQDADSSQQEAIEAALAGNHILIEGPPGTGKSQTIANIIAGAAARGKTVLFVAQKRAAIEAVTARLSKVELDGLVLDLHQTNTSKRHVAQQLADSLAKTAQEGPTDVEELNQRLSDRRARLDSYAHERRKQREPWRISAHLVQEQLLLLGNQDATGCSVRGSALTALDASAVPRVKEDLRTFVESGGLRLLRHDTPWAQSPIRSEEEIRKALYELDDLTSKTLGRSQHGMRRLLGQAALPEPPDLAGWQDILSLLDGVAGSVRSFGGDIFGEQLDDLHLGTAPSKERAATQRKLSWRQRRALLKRARLASTQGVTKKRQLHIELTEVLRQRTQWRALGGPQARPSQVVGLTEVMTDYRLLREQLAAVAMCAQLQHPEQQPTQQMEHTLRELSDDRDMVFHLPALHALLDKFAAAGLSDLVAEIAKRNATAEQAQRMFRHMWLRCLADEFKLRSSVLREFTGLRQSRLAEEFRDADIDHIAMAARRVRRKVAIALRRACDDHPSEKELLRKEANKKSHHFPLRKLVEDASHVLLALRPCWAMSPLVVSRTLPICKLFDLVVFDEASQIQPHDAVTSIMRGDRLVVAGDDKQLPPTNFFDRTMVAEDDDEDSTNLSDYESILSTMRPLIQQQYQLRWHYRSQDERLIEFSNNEIYGNDLVTFPGRQRESPVRLDVVDGVASPGQGGSSIEEAQRVVELIIEHAEQRPQESLGVIVLGATHLKRVEQAVRAMQAERTDLAECFSTEAGLSRRFFLKNIETVQGDERDAIILSVGVAKQANGNVNRTGFGPLNREGGKRRLNVAVTRAKRRMTVVSSFPPVALATSDTVTGTELLRRYLEFAERGGDIAAVGRSVGGELNGFERAIAQRLTDHGITVHPQWGVSGYRIDFALEHRGQPGNMTLAVEADGDVYHRARSARDRDRLRQEHLERLGWRFHRVWASAWYSNPEAETRRIVEAWERAMAEADLEPVPARIVAAPQVQAPAVVRRSPRPDVPRGLKTPEYSDSALIAECRWLISDGLPLDREERIDQALNDLGFQRRGPRIVERLRHAAGIAQQLADGEER